MKDSARLPVWSGGAEEKKSTKGSKVLAKAAAQSYGPGSMQTPAILSGGYKQDVFGQCGSWHEHKGESW